MAIDIDKTAPLILVSWFVVNPGAKERLVQITGTSEDKIQYVQIIYLQQNQKNIKVEVYCQTFNNKCIFYTYKIYLITAHLASRQFVTAFLKHLFSFSQLCEGFNQRYDTTKCIASETGAELRWRERSNGWLQLLAQQQRIGREQPAAAESATQLSFAFVPPAQSLHQRRQHRRIQVHRHRR